MYNTKNIIENKDLFIQIMQNLSNKIQSVFIRVSSKELDDIIDSDLINMSMDKTPIFICEKIKDKIYIGQGCRRAAIRRKPWATGKSGER